MIAFEHNFCRSTVKKANRPAKDIKSERVYASQSGRINTDFGRVTRELFDGVYQFMR